MDAMICDRCGVGTERFFQWAFKYDDDVILCPECCLNYIIKLMEENEISSLDLQDWAHAKK